MHALLRCLVVLALLLGPVPSALAGCGMTYGPVRNPASSGWMGDTTREATCHPEHLSGDVRATTAFAFDAAEAATERAPEDPVVAAQQALAESVVFARGTWEPWLPGRLLIPCLTVDVDVQRPDEAGGGRVRFHQDPLPCEILDARFSLNATPFGGEGGLVLVLGSDVLGTNVLGDDAQTLPPPLLAPLGGLFGAPPGQSRPIPVADRPQAPGVVIAISFAASWGEGCASARGAVEVRVDGERQPARIPEALFRDLCALSWAPSPDAMTAEAATATARLAQGIAGLVPAPPLAAMLDAFRALLPPLPSTEPADEGATEGNATVETFGEDSFVAERHNATVASALAEEDVQGGIRLAWPLAAFSPSPSGPAAWTGAGASPAADRARAGSSGGAPPSAASPPIPGASPTGDARADDDAAAGSATRSRPPDAASGTFARAAIAAAGALAALAAFALFQRIQRGAALRHPGRAALLRACGELGRGATAGELARLVGMERKTAEYHLRYLARLGHLHALREPDQPTRFALRAQPAAASEAGLAESVLRLIRERPGVCASEIAQDLGVSRPRVDRRVKDLLLEGVVAGRVEEGRRRLYPAS